MQGFPGAGVVLVLWLAVSSQALIRSTYNLIGLGSFDKITVH